jgi:hypothetical protein
MCTVGLRSLEHLTELENQKPNFIGGLPAELEQHAP